MKITAIKKILLAAQRFAANGVVITSKHSVPFDFSSNTECRADIFGIREEDDIVSIVSNGHQYHIEASAVTNIDIHPHRD